MDTWQYWTDKKNQVVLAYSNNLFDDTVITKLFTVIIFFIESIIIIPVLQIPK